MRLTLLEVQTLGQVTLDETASTISEIPFEPRPQKLSCCGLNALFLEYLWAQPSLRTLLSKGSSRSFHMPFHLILHKNLLWVPIKLIVFAIV